MADYTSTVNQLWPFLQTAESSNNPNAVSPMGAFGLAQLMPATAADPGFGVAPYNPSVPGDNVRMGKDYLGAMLARYSGNVPEALAAYNWGPGHLTPGQPFNLSATPAATQDYVNKIQGNSMPDNPSGLLPPGIGTPPQQPPAPQGFDWGSSNPLWMMLMGLGGGIASGAGQGWGPGLGAGIGNAMNYLNTQRMYGLKAAELAIKEREANVHQQTANQNSPSFDPSHPELSQLPPGPITSPQPTSIVPPTSAPSSPASAPAPAQAAPPAAPAASGPNFDENYVNSLPPMLRYRTLAILKGDQPLPNMMRPNPVNTAITNAVNIATGGKFDAGMYARNQAMLTDATSGAMGDKINAGSTFAAHSADFVNSAKALANIESNIKNATSNAQLQILGGQKQAALAAFIDNKNALLGEATKLWAAGKGSEGELKGWTEGLNENQPLRVQLASAGHIAVLSEGKLKAIDDQIASSVPKGFDGTVPKAVSPTSRQLLNQVERYDKLSTAKQMPSPNALALMRANKDNKAYQQEFESRFGPADAYGIE